MVGYNRQTLAGPLAGYAQLVGVDDAGEPNGVVNQNAREPMTLQLLHYNNDVRAVERFAERIPRDLNRAGITAILDAAFSPEALPVYEKLLRTSRMTMRVTLAQFFDPDRERTPDRKPDWPGMLARAEALRQRYADHPLLRADFVKLFADGGVEGNPFGVPPSPGNSPMLVPYLQPRFTTDAAGHSSVTGYVVPTRHPAGMCGRRPRPTRVPQRSRRSSRHRGFILNSAAYSVAICSTRVRCCSSSPGGFIGRASICTST